MFAWRRRRALGCLRFITTNYRRERKHILPWREKYSTGKPRAPQLSRRALKPKPEAGRLEKQVKTMKLKGLGRGLDALLAANLDVEKVGESLQNLAISLLQPGKYQPRTRMDQQSLAELAESIK